MHLNGRLADPAFIFFGRVKPSEQREWQRNTLKGDYQRLSVSYVMGVGCCAFLDCLSSDLLFSYYYW
jgi:hypothetical protein